MSMLALARCWRTVRTLPVWLFAPWPLGGPWAALSCGVGPVPVAQSPHDPSAPSAAAGADPLPSDSLPSEGAEGQTAGGHGGPSAGAEYVCPMHDDVRSPKPGRCPKCGMALRQLATAAPKNTSHSHGGGHTP
jgi:hypothetical protein